jgi:hypothetical protein
MRFGYRSHNPWKSAFKRHQNCMCTKIIHRIRDNFVTVHKFCLIRNKIQSFPRINTNQIRRNVGLCKLDYTKTGFEISNLANIHKLCTTKLQKNNTETFVNRIDNFCTNAFGMPIETSECELTIVLHSVVGGPIKWICSPKLVCDTETRIHASNIDFLTTVP